MTSSVRRLTLRAARTTCRGSLYVLHYISLYHTYCSGDHFPPYNPAWFQGSEGLYNEQCPSIGLIDRRFELHARPAGPVILSRKGWAFSYVRGPVLLSFCALSGRLEFTVRRHKFMEYFRPAGGYSQVISPAYNPARLQGCIGLRKEQCLSIDSSSSKYVLQGGGHK